ncbi:MAG: TonB-dependent receptor [Gammaproteobacteria bacterium]|nr:TonB-dependent receptor [Gammaproteobacteria bacterium]
MISAIASAFFSSLRLQTVLLFAAGFVVMATAPVVAEEAVDNIVVTGARTTDELSEISNTTSVVRRAEIEARNKTSVADLLRNLPGVHVVQPSGQGGVARIFLRGGDQNLTMILLDGIRVNNPMDTRGSAFDFSVINMNDIERIEIVRGPQSAVYGSDALAGVINIITREPADKLGGSVFAEIGADDYFRAALDLSGPVGDGGGFSLRVASKDDGEPVTGTTFESDSVTGRLTFGGGESWQMRLVGSYSESNGSAFPEDSGGAALAVLRTVDTRSAEDFRLGLNGSVVLSDRWTLNVLATWYENESGYFSPGIAPGIRGSVPPNGGDATLQRADLAVNAVVSISEALKGTFGVDYYDEDGVSDGFVEFFPGFSIPAGYDFNRSVVGAFGELHYKIASGPTLLASVRRDNPDEESGETTSKLGIVHEFNDGQTSMRANWGQGFSLPGFFALASPLVGNPDLLPETSTSFDIGVTRWSADKRTSGSLTLFRNQFKDLIDFDSTLFMMVNREGVDADGVEMQLDYSASENLYFRMQATYTDYSVENSETPLRQRPEWAGSVAMRWTPAEQWLIDASWLFVGETFDSSIPTDDLFLDSYSRLDVTATLKYSEKLHLLLSIDNLLDENYQEAIGFPPPGFRARLGLRYRF